jgi:hypothetical protein
MNKKFISLMLATLMASTLTADMPTAAQNDWTDHPLGTSG